MAACGRSDLEMSIPVVQLLLERGANAANQASPSSLLGEGTLCSRLGLSRDTPIKNAASQSELLRLLVDAGAVLDAHVVVYAVEDWCDEIAEHLEDEWASKTDVAGSKRAVDYVDDGNAAAALNSGGDDGGGETKIDAAATTNKDNSAQAQARRFAGFSSQIAATLQEVLGLGGDVNARDATGTKRDGMNSCVKIT